MMQHLVRLTETAMTYVRKFRERDLKLKQQALAAAQAAANQAAAQAETNGQASERPNQSNILAQAQHTYEQNTKMILLDISPHIQVSVFVFASCLLQPLAYRAAIQSFLSIVPTFAARLARGCKS